MAISSSSESPSSDCIGTHIFWAYDCVIVMAPRHTVGGVISITIPFVENIVAA